VTEGTPVEVLSGLASDEVGAEDNGEKVGEPLAMERLVEKGPSSIASTTNASIIRRERRFLERSSLARAKMPIGAIVR